MRSLLYVIIYTLSCCLSVGIQGIYHIDHYPPGSVVKEIETVILTIQDIRENIQTHHAKWFLTMESMCYNVGTVLSLPRRCGRQTHRSNTPANTPSEYYCHTMSIPLLDHLLFRDEVLVWKTPTNSSLRPLDSAIRNLVSCTNVICHHLIALRVSYTAGNWNGQNSFKNM